MRRFLEFVGGIVVVSLVMAGVFLMFGAFVAVMLEFYVA